MDEQPVMDERAQALQEKLDAKLGGRLGDSSELESDSELPIEDEDESIQIGEQAPKNIDENNQEEIALNREETFETTLESDEDSYNEQDLEEYAEKVSDEDFSEFLGAALEEISEDPEMARAIVVEMAKIYKVQPDHQQKIIQFYEDCARSSKIPDEIKNICDRERYNLK